MMYSLFVLSQTFKVLPQHVSRTFALRMLCKRSIHKFNQESVFTSSGPKYSTKISFYPFPKNTLFSSKNHY